MLGLMLRESPEIAERQAPLPLEKPQAIGLRSDELSEETREALNKLELGQEQYNRVPEEYRRWSGL